MRIEAKVVGHAKMNPDDFFTLDHVQASGQDYSGRRLKKYTSIGSRFERCRFDNLRVMDASLGSGKSVSEYIECTFDGMQIEHGGGFARFVGCSFKNVKLKGWLSKNGEFVNCVFSGCMEDCVFFGTVPENERAWVGRERNEFHGNDFSACDLVSVAFRTGINLPEQRLPAGPEYLYLPDAAAAIEQARAVVRGWYDSVMREKGLQLMRGLQVDVDAGQRQRLLRPDNFLHVFPREVIDGVFAALLPNTGQSEGAGVDY